MNQIVEFVSTRITNKISYLPDKFQFRSDRPAHWLQRFALWILRKLKCNSPFEFESIERVRIDTRKFIEALYTQDRELLNLYHTRGEMLLIGPRELGQLLGEDYTFGRPIKFETEYMADGGMAVYGMKVTVVPWMKGMLVVPRSVIQ